MCVVWCGVCGLNSECLDSTVRGCVRAEEIVRCVFMCVN